MGVDLGKNSFQLHAPRVEGGSAISRKLSRSKMRGFFARIAPCRVGMEACGSAHYWARELTAMGHDVVLMPPPSIKPGACPRA
jgi:transposase